MCETTDVIRGGTLNKVLVHPLGCLPSYGNGLHASILFPPRVQSYRFTVVGSILSGHQEMYACSKHKVDIGGLQSASTLLTLKFLNLNMQDGAQCIGMPSSVHTKQVLSPQTVQTIHR